MIIDKMPEQLKSDYGVWTRKAVKELVKREFGVVLAINTTGDLLAFLGFFPSKAKEKSI
jgi:transposase